MSFCINSSCNARENPETSEICASCGNSLIIFDQSGQRRFRVIYPIKICTLETLYETNFEVFEAIVEDLESEIAAQSVSAKLMILKVLINPTMALEALLMQEARILQELDYQGFFPKVGINDFFPLRLAGSDVHTLCLAMEKLEGKTLQQSIEQDGPIQQDLALNWLVQLIDILEILHDRNILHLDIHPSNLIVHPNGQIALIDFGSAWVKTTAKIFLSHTPRYSPLEQVEGKPEFYSDYFALGRTFIYALTGIPLQDLAIDEIGGLAWRSHARQIDLPILNFIDHLMSPRVSQRPANPTQLNLQFDQLFVHLKQYRRRRSPLFRAGAVAVLSLLMVFVYQSLVKPLVANNYFEQANDKQRKRDAKGAIFLFKKAIQWNPNNNDYYQNLGIACSNVSDFPCAESNFLKALALSPNDWEVYYNLAILYEDSENYSKAEQHYQKAIELAGNVSALPLGNLSRLKNITGYPLKAQKLAQAGLQVIEPIIKQETDKNFRLILQGQKAALLKNLGWAEYLLKNYDQALVHLTEASNLDLNRADAYCLIAQVYEAQKNFSQANTFWSLCLQLGSDPGNPEVLKWKKQFLERLLPKVSQQS